MLLILLRNLLHEGMDSRIAYFIAGNLAKQFNLAGNTLCVFNDVVENLEPIKEENINRNCAGVGVLEAYFRLIVDFDGGL